MGCKSVLFFYGFLKLRFPDVEVNPIPRVAHQFCRNMFTNINVLHGNRDELAIAASKLPAFDFATVAGCSQLVNGPTHRAGGVLDLVLINVPDLCVGFMFMAMLVGLTMRRLESHWIYHRLLLDLMQLAGFPWSSELIGIPFVSLCLDLTGEVFSVVRPWFTILIGKSVELWSDSFLWLLWGEEELTRPGLMVVVGELLSWSSQLIIVSAGTVLLWTGIYSAKHEELLIDSMRLRRLVTLRTAVGTLMTGPLRMPGGVH